MSKIIFSLLLLFLSVGRCLAVEKGHCDANGLLELVRGGKDLYLGEMHGTAETPALIQCLVEEALLHKRKPLYVSLELPMEARDPGSSFWSGTDGRSSEAMWLLVQFLMRHENTGELTLCLQYSNEAKRVAGQNRAEEIIGNDLNNLAKKGQLIAMSGSFHSRKAPANYAPNLKPAGMYAGDSVIHIFVEPIERAAWTCDGSGCGAHKYPRTPLKNARSGMLVHAEEVGHAYAEEIGHDYIFFLARSTASPPHLSSVK